MRIAPDWFSLGWLCATFLRNLTIRYFFGSLAFPNSSVCACLTEGGCNWLSARLIGLLVLQLSTLKRVQSPMMGLC